MGDTSAEQEVVLAQVREWVQQSGFNKTNRWDDYDLLRFCRGRKFVLVDIQKMFQDHINWRAAQSIDDITTTWQFPEADKVAEIYPQFYHKVDKKGRPLYIERLGTLDVTKLWTVTTEERMMRNFA